ncbi:hypothetical protein M436DRAFT_82942 [Aureobasidium namibiae CBS 147.97]|uniref:Uncharacterized protein n=1 Tax=Aureobasidium namibiae CBS 147.97 TaxID=1043004 RepID=A0A074WQQ6_9PEZI
MIPRVNMLTRLLKTPTIQERAQTSITATITSATVQKFKHTVEENEKLRGENKGLCTDIEDLRGENKDLCVENENLRVRNYELSRELEDAYRKLWDRKINHK